MLHSCTHMTTVGVKVLTVTVPCANDVAYLKTTKFQDKLVCARERGISPSSVNTSP